ncbi:MAG: hypothetical protein DMF63_13965 [Acidobacteria bacterium]|nr:MAG: hypothetical protein DMF63_13965 [Acidobacteriota bacterium]
MLKQAVAYYNELLEDEELAASSFQILHDGLEHNKLIFGGRPLSPYLRPHFVTESDWKSATEACETIWSALQKVKDAAVADDALLEELGVTEIEKELVRIDPGYKQVSPTARLDSFLTEDAYSFVELNGESPAGIAFADSATEIFESLPVMKKFAERYSVRGFDGRPKMLQVLLDCYTEFNGGKPETNPTIAIVDLKDLPTVKEFELFRDYFQVQGYTAVICSPDQLEFDGEKLFFESVAIDIVYKRLLVNEYLPIMDEQHALLDAYRAGAICMVNSFRGKLVHKKAIFAVLTNERYSHLFDEQELSAIQKHVPWTRKFREERTQVRSSGSHEIQNPKSKIQNAEEVDLVSWTRENSSKLVLKPNDDYGGHGIYIGWNSSESEWDEAIKAALSDGDYLVQERVKTAKEMFPMMFDDLGKWGMVEQLVDLDPLLFNGVVGAAFTRLSSSELANVSSGGGMVPTFIIGEKE